MFLSKKIPLEPHHLCTEEIINFGSFYTPLKYVNLAGIWLKKHGITDDYIIFDPSCGYGSFFRLKEFFNNNKYLGNDIDKSACFKAKRLFPFTKIFNLNLFNNYKRECFDIKADEKIVIVGNPPYNDTTSQIRQDVKTLINQKMDDKVKSNDLGIASLLCYNEMKADYVLILHPLSYLIKKTNFNRGKNFFNNYELCEHIIFSSQEFEHTSKIMGFPIIVALYKRYENNGLTYEKILSLDFNTIEGDCFRLNSRDYISNFINKYPNSNRYNPEILFYTLRDINALKRSRTFIKSRENNAVDVDPRKIGFYCYVDCFKRFADVPYYMGNFDVPLIYSEFKNYEKYFIQVSKYNNKDIFNDESRLDERSLNLVKEYISKVINY